MDVIDAIDVIDVTMRRGEERDREKE